MQWFSSSLSIEIFMVSAPRETELSMRSPKAGKGNPIREIAPSMTWVENFVVVGKSPCFIS